MNYTINIENTPIFKHTNNSYNGSLKVLRTFLFLDQCHDFLESTDRNQWRPPPNTPPNTLDQAYNILRQNLFTDIEYIDSNWPDKHPEVDTIIDKLKALLPPDNRKKAKVSTQNSILKNFVEPLQTEIKIGDVDLGQIMGSQFSPEDQAKNIVSIMDPQNTGTYLLIGVDADKAADHFFDLANHVLQGNIILFDSPASAYDAASGSTFINYLKTKIAQQKGLTSPNQVPTVPGTTIPLYSLRLIARGLIVFEFEYLYRGLPNSYKLNIKNFFNTTPPPHDIYSGQGSNNSIFDLTSQFTPSDEIFLYKTFGDFGQILSFYIECGILGEGWTCIFSSFDQLSAIISSLFNRCTLLETTKAGPNNLNIYSLDPSVIRGAMHKIRQIGLDGLSGASIIHSLQFPGGRFGKVTNYKKNSYSENQIKLAKKYRIKLDKNINVNINKVLKMHELAKKLRINLTTVNSNDERIYKTPLKLESEIKSKLKR
tara:strand:- start:154 stop:1602 length:1449 start_codon:yes stop_codon:yes gene_type:complete